MSSIPKISLEDSLYVLQLARETALAQNRATQAQRMQPVVEQMRKIVTSAPAASTPPASGVMGQTDFKTLLNVSQARLTQTPTGESTSAALERNRLIGAMAEANMSEVDIARQFNMSREEVQLVLNVQQKNSYGKK